MTYPKGPRPLTSIVGWYLDSENSLICPECAEESNTYDEVPHFRPVTLVTDLTVEDMCLQCGRLARPEEVCDS